MNDWSKKFLRLMAEATARRSRVERVYHRHVIAEASVAKVEHAHITAQKLTTEARARWRTPRSWDKPDGFELAVFRPPGTRVFVPPHLYMTTDRTWRVWEVP